MYTRYCHLGQAMVHEDDNVERGQIIGYVGLTGETHRDFVHLHFELQSRLHHNYIAQGWTQDPQPLVIGCFRRANSYPIDRFVLTWPLEC